MALGILSAVIFAVWFVLVVLLGKGGMVHILLLNAVGIAFVSAMAAYRTRMGNGVKSNDF